MNRILVGPSVAIAVFLSATPAVFAAHQTSLTQAAAQLGYVLLTEQRVQTGRAGHAGEAFHDIANRLARAGCS